MLDSDRIYWRGYGQMGAAAGEPALHPVRVGRRHPADGDGGVRQNPGRAHVRGATDVLPRAGWVSDICAMAAGDWRV